MVPLLPTLHLASREYLRPPSLFIDELLKEKVPHGSIQVSD
jgi:hypothetical protein